MAQANLTRWKLNRVKFDATGCCCNTTALCTKLLTPRPTPGAKSLCVPIYIFARTQALFGKPADSLERSTENEDEYMIHERDVSFVFFPFSCLCHSTLLCGYCIDSG